MGGCRCSYRNCTVRTDGTTHMFHYPVFDKLRCHHWLTNAQKQEFLNLKVSQLKNRVVCQHHFKDEFFMNFKKDKLTFKAIPTLNGPFCDSGPNTDTTVSLDEGKLYPISLDDIETEYLSLSDKKATFSVKYGDFLTNSEVMDMDTIDISSIHNKAQKLIKDDGKKCTDDEDPLAINPIDNKNSTVMNILPNDSTIIIGDNQSQLGDLTPAGFILVQPTSVGAELDELQINTKNPNGTTQKSNNNSVTQVMKQNQSFSSQYNTEVPKEQKIKILSQKKISGPLSLTGKLEPVSPSLILRIPEKKNKQINQENITSANEKDENQASYINILNNNSVNVLPSNDVTIAVDQKQINKKVVQAREKVLKNTLNIGLSSNKSLLKSKINEDRVAAIKEKRKFNMKLRDIIESCLDKIDDQDNGQTISETNTKNDQVGTFLSKNTALPSVHEYTIACLEARMKRMEDVLLNKIDQNTQRIMELKNSIVSSDKKSTCTQTTNNEQLKKKQLYQEISKYLSADANSLIYEELFINEYTQSTSHNIASPKRRRRR